MSEASSWDYGRYRAGERNLDKMASLRAQYEKIAGEALYAASRLRPGGFLHGVCMWFHRQYDKDVQSLEADIGKVISDAGKPH